MPQPSPLSPKPSRLVLFVGTALVLVVGLPLAYALRTADDWAGRRYRRS